MYFPHSAALFFVLILQLRAVKPLESVEELLCQNMEEGSRIPHPELCNVYIMCMENSAMQISCEHRIFYNPESEICDPEYRICLGGMIKDRNGSVIRYEEEEGTTDSSDSETEVESESESMTKSPTSGTIQTLTTLFELIETTTRKTTTKVTTYATTISTETIEPNMTAKPVNAPINCPANDSENLLILGHAAKCSVYYICYHGKPIPMECSQGLYWSEQKYKCVPKELSECHARSANTYPNCPDEGIEFLPHDKDCRFFWFCRDGYRMLQQCDAFLQWDVNERRCKKIGHSVCFKDLVKSNTSSFPKILYL